MYVTPGAYRTKYLGSDVSGLSDLQLASLLERSSTIADGYCSVPLIPQRHDFRGGSIVGETHSWRLPDGNPASNNVGQRRAYPFHWPIKSVSAFRIAVQASVVALDIDVDQLIIQNSERYLEVVTLIGTTFGLFNSITMPNVWLATPTLRIDYTYGFEYRSVLESIYNEDGATRKVWRAQNQWWLVDASNTVEVYVNGVLQTVGFTYDAGEGTVTFTAAPAAGATVTVSYTYRLPAEVRDAVCLIARYELGESKLAAKGLQGVESIKMAELAITRSRVQRSGTVNEHNLSSLVPEAADLLDGLKFFRMAA